MIRQTRTKRGSEKPQLEHTLNADPTEDHGREEHHSVEDTYPLQLLTEIEEEVEYPDLPRADAEPLIEERKLGVKWPSIDDKR